MLSVQLPYISMENSVSQYDIPVCNIIQVQRVNCYVNL